MQSLMKIPESIFRMNFMFYDCRDISFGYSASNDVICTYMHSFFFIFLYNFFLSRNQFFNINK